MSDGNGRWQLAFWVISVICGAWLLSLTTGVVTNYFRNEDQHTAIVNAFGCKLNTIESKIDNLKEIILPVANQVSANTPRIARLEDKVYGK